MLQRVNRKAQRPNSISVSVPAPVGGWNARDSLAEMASTDAVSMVNMFPYTTSVGVRYGYTQYATGLPAPVETLMYYFGAATKTFFAITSNGSIYDVTAGGAVGAASVTGLTNGRWQYVNNTTAAASYLQLVNGTDKMQYYTGSAWAKDGDGAPYDITVANSATFINICIHKFRVWAVQKNTLKAWYSATGAIGGAYTVLDLSSVAQMGGSLIACATWTIDAGYGVDDMLVFMTTNGEAIVYRGTDPSSASTWALVGVYRFGTPIGTRCWVKFAGDLLLITQDGVIPLSSALQSDRLDQKQYLTNKIQFATSVAISSYGSNFGWQIIPFPKENMLFLNVPVSAGADQQQFVMNTINKSWCNFTGWEANCWELFNDDIYFGGSDYVGKAWSGLSDNNTNINGNTLQAFGNFGNQGVQKRFTMMRPTLLTNGSPSILANMNIDFDLSDPTSALSFSPTTYGAWDSGVWDTAIWGTDAAVQNNWQGANGIGYWAAPRLKTGTLGISCNWITTTIVFEGGAIL